MKAGVQLAGGESERTMQVDLGKGLPSCRYRAPPTSGQRHPSPSPALVGIGSRFTVTSCTGVRLHGVMGENTG